MLLTTKKQAMKFIYNNLEVTINSEDQTVTLTELSNRAKTTDHSFDHFGGEDGDSDDLVADLVKEWLDDQAEAEKESEGYLESMGE